MSGDNIKVCIKVRPLIDREKRDELKIVWEIKENKIKSLDGQYEKVFDHIYDESKTTLELFEGCAKPIVEKAMKGFNGTIFAYGQTSSGKTYTMMGTPENPGVIPLCVEEIFEQISSISDRVFLIRVGYIEIYNEKVFDLLKPDRPEIAKIREESCDQQEFVATNIDEIMGHYDDGNKVRKVGETGMNEKSSRSHTIFRITIESREEGEGEGAVQVSHLNLVDLAGSERLDQTGATGDRLQEGKNINLSLHALSNVIRNLAEKSDGFVNKRDSKLTRILSNSLGGNAVTAIICTITPVSLEESHSTLNFAQNAKKIKNKPKVNEIMSEQTMMRSMQRTIDDLRKKLECEMLKNNKYESNILQEDIDTRERAFLHSHNTTERQADKMRRRTWCPNSITNSVAMPPPSNHHRLPSLDQAIPPFLIDPLKRNPSPIEENDDEEFKPSNEVNLDQTLSPGGSRTTDELARTIFTPRGFKKSALLDFDSPDMKKMSEIEQLKRRIEAQEEELKELNDFIRIERIVTEDHYKISSKLEASQALNEQLQAKLDDLNYLLEESKLQYEEQLNQVKTALSEKKKALELQTIAQSTLAGVEMEFESYKSKSKKREAELISCLDEARGSSNNNSMKAHESHDEKLKMKISELENQLKEAETSKIEINSKYQQEVDKIISLEEQLNKATQTIKALEENHKNEIDRLKEENLKLTENQSSNDEIETLKLKLQSLEDQYNESTNQHANIVKDFKSQIKKLTEDYDETSTQLMDKVDDIDNLQKKVTTLSEKNDIISKIIQKITDTNVEVTICDDLLEDDIIRNLMKFTEVLKNTETDLASYQESNNALRQEIELLNENIKQISTELMQRDDQVKSLENQLSAQGTELHSEIIELKKGLQSLVAVEEENTRLKRHEKESRRRMSDFTAKEKELKQILSENESLHHNLEELSISLVEKTNELSKLRESFAAIQDKANDSITIHIQRLENENLEMKQMLEESKTCNESHQETLKKMFDEYNLKIDKIEKEHNREKAELGADLLDSLNNANEIITQLESKIADLENSEKCSAFEMSNLQNKLSSVKKLLEENQSLINSKNVIIEELQKLQQNQPIGTVEIDEMNQKLFDAEKSKKDLEIQLANALEEIENYKNDVQALEQQLSSVKEKVEATQDLIKDIDKLDNEVDLFEDEPATNTDKDEEIRTLNDENNNLKSQINELESNLENVKKSLEEVEHLKEEIKSLTSQVSILKTQNEELEINLDETQKMSQHSEEIETMKQQNQDLTNQITSLTTEIDDLNEKLSAANNKQIQITQEFDDKIISLENQKSDLVTKLEEAKNTIQSLSSLENSKEELQEYVNKVGDLEAQRDQLLASLNEVKESLKSAQESITSLENENSTLSNNIQDMKDALKSNKVEIEEILNPKIQALQDEISQLSVVAEENNHLKSSLEALKEQLDEISNSKAQLELEISKLSTVAEANEELKRAMNAQKEELQEILHSKIELQAEITELTRQKNLLDAENTNSKAKVFLIESEVEKLKESLKRKTNEVEEVKLTHKRRSSENSETMHLLEREKQEILQKMGAAEARRVLAEHQLDEFKTNAKKIEDDITKENQKLIDKANENDYKITLLEEQLEQAKIDLKTLEETKQAEFTKLTLERELLVQQVEELKKQKLSPTKRRDSDLFAPHLLKEKGPSTPRSVELNKDRRRSRQNLQDSRRWSSWERFNEIAIQTDNVNEICACSELQQKIKDLEVDLVRKQCRITTFEEREKHHPLKTDLDQANRHLQREQREHSQKKSQIELLEKKISKLESRIDRDTNDYKQMKSSLEARIDSLTKNLQHANASNAEALSNRGDKENMSVNIASRSNEIEIQLLRKKVVELEELTSRLQTDDTKNSALVEVKKELEAIVKKYDMVKRLCNLRNEDNNQLKLKVDDMTKFINESQLKHEKECEALRQKYIMARELGDFRRKKIDELENALKNQQ